MAEETKYHKKKIQDTENSGFGHYSEYVGGGASPKPKSSVKRSPGVNSDYRKENNDTEQPRTDDGKFTYKSVNGKAISTKYGPSRGKTVNPLLTGGQNGIKIEDVEEQFEQQEGEFWDKYKDSWYRKGGEIVTTDLKTRIASDYIWEVAKRRYDVKKGEFTEETEVFEYAKRGRRGKEEEKARQEAEKSGEEQAAIRKETGGIKEHKVKRTDNSTPTAPTMPTNPEPPTKGPTGQTPVTPIIKNPTSEQIEYVRQSINDLGQEEFNNISNEDIKELMSNEEFMSMLDLSNMPQSKNDEDNDDGFTFDDDSDDKVLNKMGLNKKDIGE